MDKKFTFILMTLVLLTAGLSLNAAVTRSSTPGVTTGDDNCTGADGTGGPADPISYSDITSPSITDVDVRVAIDHGWRPDLQFHVSYTGGGGNVILAADHGTSANDDYYATFDDEAGSACILGCGGTACSMTAAPGPTCSPDGALSAFDGLTTPGTFSLVVCDDSAAISGTLQEWEVTADGLPDLPVELMSFGIE